MKPQNTTLQNAVWSKAGHWKTWGKFLINIGNRHEIMDFWVIERKK
jgi:hypothetical protein